MIAKLRRRFILISTGSVALVLVLLMGIVNAASFVKLDRSAGELLEFLAENRGSFPETGFPAEPEPASPTDAAPVFPMGRRGFSAETPYETRFFTVELSSDGALCAVDTGKIAAISTGDAAALARELWQKGSTGGYTGSYKYLARETDAGVMYVFLDCTRDLSSMKSFLINSLLVSLCGLAAVLGLVMALSRRAVRPVAESYQKQKEFITNAGHEIKTPLAVIDSCAEVLEMEQGESKWSQGIREQVRRLSALTEGLVSLARMDEGSASLPREDFDLSEALEESLDPFALLAERRGLTLSAEIEPHIRYCGSEAALRELFTILADNAVKYANPGGGIAFTLARRGRRPVLTASNPAPGLRRGDQSAFFDRFYRGDASRSSEKRGYGIGLSMAQAITAAHGGKIDARSDDGRTLTVTVTL